MDLSRRLVGRNLPMSTKMIVFDIPKDPDFLQAFAHVSLTHAHLDYSLRMCVKTLADVSVHEALEATEYAGSKRLRDRIRKLAKMRLGEGTALVKLQSLLKRCAAASADRNELIHNIVARDQDSEEFQIRSSDHSWRELPKADELFTLAQRLTALAVELNHARLAGWLRLALDEKARL